ncbi:hypothetical protein CR513_38499, partial [Mucuna pruriens]
MGRMFDNRRRLIVLAVQERPSWRQDPSITFAEEDYEDTITHSDDPMIILFIITDYMVERVLVDHGSSINVLFWLAFRKMGFSEANLEAWEQVKIWGVGMGSTVRAEKIKFTIVNASTSYNVTLSRTNLDDLGPSRESRPSGVSLDRGSAAQGLRPKVVRGDFLACHRTLVDLFLNALDNKGEPSLLDHGDHRERRIYRIHTLDGPSIRVGGCTSVPKRGFERNLGGFRALSEDKNWSIPRVTNRGDCNTDT